jgi:hypothetical protein
LSSDNRDTNELTHRSVLLSLDNRDVDELINRLVHLIQDSESRLVGNNLQTDQFILGYRNMYLQTD